MIEASTVKVSTMADSTLRIVLDIEPRHAQEAFALFGVRGSPCVIARLTPEAATASARAETVADDTVSMVADDKPKGGDLARLAGQFCNDSAFRLFLSQKTACDYDNAAEAAELVRQICGVDSRAELDHDQQAAETFHSAIRRPYVEWRKARGLA